MLAVLFFFLMIRRPPRSTPLSLHDALPIWDNRLILPKSSYRRQGLAPRCRLITSWGWRRSQGSGCSPVKVVRELGSERRSEEHTSELQSRQYLVCRLLLEKKKKYTMILSY